MDISKTKILILSMPKSRKRRAFMDFKMKEMGIAYEFLDAVDGRSLKEKYNEYASVCAVEGKEVLVGGLPCYGCLASHCKFFQENPPDHYIVFEDDIYFHKRFHEIIGSMPSDTMEKYDVLYLGHNNIELSDDQRSAILGGEMFVPVDKKIMTHGNYAMMYSPRAMIFLKEFMTMDMPQEDVAPNDNIIWRHAANDLSSAIVNPTLAIPEVRMSNIRVSKDIQKWCEHRLINPDDYTHVDMYKDYAGLD